MPPVLDEPMNARPLSFLISLMPLSAVAPALVAQAEAAPDSMIVGRWSARVGMSVFSFVLEPDGRYRIWTVTSPGETLVLSMGDWQRPQPDRFCLTPFRGKQFCGTLTLEHKSADLGLEWRFEDTGERPFLWIAYRMGLAPWDTLAVLGRVDEVYESSEVAEGPRLIGCTEPLLLPAGVSGPLIARVRFVVERDSSVTHVETVDALSDDVRTVALKVGHSCRAAPARLPNGRLVRARAELPIPFPARSRR